MLFEMTINFRPVMNLAHRSFFLFLAGIASAAALLAALTAQYGFNLAPCQLCLYQRIPYMIIMALAIAGFALKRNASIIKALLLFCIVLFTANAALAFYHTGIENHWWTGVQECSAPLAQTLDALREQLYSRPVTRCDEIVWSLFGISMAGYNALFSALMAVISLTGFLIKARTS